MGKLRTLKIQTQLKDPSYLVKGDPMIDPNLVGWKDTLVRPSQKCRHFDSICQRCVDTWKEDFYIRVIDTTSGNTLSLNDAPGELDVTHL